MFDFDDFDIPPGKQGRIGAIDHDGLRATIEFKDGSVGSMTASDSIGFEVGANVIVWEDSDRRYQVNELPADLVPRSTSIGTVKLVTPGTIVVEVEGRLKKVTSQIGEVRKGATVEVDSSDGIVTELSSTPIRIIDLADESSRVDDFIVTPRAGAAPLNYTDFAGFPDLVEEARELIELSLDSDERLQKIGGRPIKGLLFTGDPGSGKTLLARIISEQVGATFYQINGPAVMGRWVGQSEEVLRAIFDHASARRPAIIFFDEIDSLAARRDVDSSESSQRVVAQLLTLMDGFHATERLLVIAATNRVDQIDQALRRPGRFDREIGFRLPDRSDRISILALGESRFKFTDPIPKEVLADLTEGWSSAEVSAIWNEAAVFAASDGRVTIRLDDYRGGHERQSRLREMRLRQEQK